MRAYWCLVRTAALAIALLGAPAMAQEAEQADAAPPPAQPQESEVIGPPQLRGFQLPGTTTTPAPRPETAEPPSSEGPGQAAEPAVTISDVAAPPATALDSEALAASEARRDAAATQVPAQTGRQTPAQPDQSTDRPAAPPMPGAAPSAARDDRAETETTTSGARPGGLPLVLMAAAGAALVGLAAILIWRRRRLEQHSEGLQEHLLAPEPQAEPEPTRPQAPRPAPAADPAASPATGAPAPAASGEVVGIRIRPWLNLEFHPAQAAATLTEAVVQYELLVRNEGNAVARNVRIETQMFNAGAEQDKEIADFFARPVGERGSARILAIPPRSGARLRSSVAMPKENVREINVEGRRLFIPMVAFNVVYEWGDGRTGQTSMSYLVGREPEKPSTKMGAFRLDLGPRVYRSVGQRPNNVAVLV